MQCLKDNLNKQLIKLKSLMPLKDVFKYLQINTSSGFNKVTNFQHDVAHSLLSMTVYVENMF
jgi:hypothetical protein